MIVVGLMSGTSLDGLDIVAVDFKLSLAPFRIVNHKIVATKSISYNRQWKQRLNDAPTYSSADLRELDVDFGRFLGEQTRLFLERNAIQADLIASHGHSVFHEPLKGYTLQIGDGNYIKAKTGVPVVYDFRSLDMALGGQGAPLVPVGDELLFGEYDACLNLGGIANISYQSGSGRLAYDVCPCNLLLDHLAKKTGRSFDSNSEMARGANLNPDVLDALEQHPYYSRKAPKSLDKEEVFREFLPLLASIPIHDAMRTLCEHYALQISQCCSGTLLTTGGGAFNTFLVERIRYHWRGDVVLPSNEIIEFKEALIFGLLGLLRYHHQNNVWASVTGASNDSCSGILV